MNTRKLGTYKITYQIKDNTYTLEVEIKDTQKPEVHTKQMTIEVGEAFHPEDGIESIKDATKTTISLKNEKETFDQIGKKNVDIIVKDEGGNITTAIIPLTILKKDTTPPVIQADDLTLQTGDTYNPMQNVSAKDDRDGNVEVKITKNNVDINEPGTYHITYTCLLYTSRDHMKLMKKQLLFPYPERHLLHVLLFVASVKHPIICL